MNPLSPAEVSPHEASHAVVGLHIGRLLVSTSCIPNTETVGRTLWLDRQPEPICDRALSTFAPAALHELTGSDAGELEKLSAMTSQDYVAGFRPVAVRVALQFETDIRRVAGVLAVRGELNADEVWDVLQSEDDFPSRPCRSWRESLLGPTYAVPVTLEVEEAVGMGTISNPAYEEWVEVQEAAHYRFNKELQPPGGEHTEASTAEIEKRMGQWTMDHPRPLETIQEDDDES